VCVYIYIYIYIYAFRPQSPFCVILPVNSMGNGGETVEVRLCCLHPRRPDGGAILRRYQNSCMGSSDPGCITTVIEDVRWVSSRTFRHTWHISVDYVLLRVVGTCWL